MGSPNFLFIRNRVLYLLPCIGLCYLFLLKSSYFPSLPIIPCVLVVFLFCFEWGKNKKIKNMYTKRPICLIFILFFFINKMYVGIEFCQKLRSLCLFGSRTLLSRQITITLSLFAKRCIYYQQIISHTWSSR